VKHVCSLTLFNDLDYEWVLITLLLCSVESPSFTYFLGDPCNPNPCLNGGACIANNIGGFTCQCPPGYSGLRCEDRDGCASQPCKNNGVCISSGGGAYTCQCPTGFDGPTCEQRILIKKNIIMIVYFYFSWYLWCEKSMHLWYLSKWS
jgi:hypothetical protein